MFSRSKNRRLLIRAIKLLNDENLVWDNDFELIRPYLLLVFRNQLPFTGLSDPNLVKIAKLLTDTTIV